MIQGGWVCRACWRPNGPGEERCYRCHTPRDEQLSVEAGTLRERTMPGWELRGRLDADLPILAWVTVLPLGITGVLNIIFGGLLALAGLLAGDEGRQVVLGIPTNIWVSLFGLLLVITGVLKISLARSVRRYARWAYIVVIGVGLLGLTGKVLGPGLPDASGDLAVISWWVDTWLTFAVTLCATALLLTSFIRRPIEESPPPH